MKFDHNPDKSKLFNFIFSLLIFCFSRRKSWPKKNSRCFSFGEENGKKRIARSQSKKLHRRRRFNFGRVADLKFIKYFLLLWSFGLVYKYSGEWRKLGKLQKFQHNHPKNRRPVISLFTFLSQTSLNLKKSWNFSQHNFIQFKLCTFEEGCCKRQKVWRTR